MWKMIEKKLKMWKNVKNTNRLYLFMSLLLDTKEILRTVNFGGRIFQLISEFRPFTFCQFTVIKLLYRLFGFEFHKSPTFNCDRRLRILPFRNTKLLCFSSRNISYKSQLFNLKKEMFMEKFYLYVRKKICTVYMDLKI